MKVNIPTVIEILGQTDVYLLDQIMKHRYLPTDHILDAGCGHGRNLHIFINAGLHVTGVDFDPEKINFCQTTYPSLTNQFSIQDLTSLKFPNDHFDHIISSAVFHFCKSTFHFKGMFNEHIRVLKKAGTLFIRMTSLFGLPPDTAIEQQNGIYHLPDYGDRFLVTYDLIDEMMHIHNLSLIEPVKTVNVQDKRAMAVILFQKN